MSHASRRSAIRLSGLAFRVCRMSHPCFLAVDSSERITANSIAPSMERKPPEIFWRNFIIRPSRSARLLLNGTLGSVRKRSTSCLRVLSRNSRLWPTRRGGRARRLPLQPARTKAGCASCNARPSARIVSYHRSNMAGTCMGLSVSSGFVVCVPDFVGGSIAPVAARWHDCSECVEVKIDNGLKGLSGGTLVQAVGQCVVPGGLLGLQRDQPGDRVIPALSSGPPVRRPTVADLRERLLGLAAGAISRLSFGVAEGVFASGLTTLWHALFSVT